MDSPPPPPPPPPPPIPDPFSCVIVCAGSSYLRACVNGGGGPQVGDVTRLSI